MISDSFDMKEFIQSVHGLDNMSIIAAADREAFDAWRCARSHRNSGPINLDSIISYEQKLKDLVAMLRCSLFDEGIDAVKIFLNGHLELNGHRL